MVGLCGLCEYSVRSASDVNDDVGRGSSRRGGRRETGIEFERGLSGSGGGEVGGGSGRIRRLYDEERRDGVREGSGGLRRDVFETEDGTRGRESTASAVLNGSPLDCLNGVVVSYGSCSRRIRS